MDIRDRPSLLQQVVANGSLFRFVFLFFLGIIKGSGSSFGWCWGGWADPSLVTTMTIQELAELAHVRLEDVVLTLEESGWDRFVDPPSATGARGGQAEGQFVVSRKILDQVRPSTFLFSCPEVIDAYFFFFPLVCGFSSSETTSLKQRSSPSFNTQLINER